MSRLVSIENACGLRKVALEDAPEGPYIFVYEAAHSCFPEKNYLQDDLVTAQEICRDDFGVPLSSWVAVTE